MRIKITKVEHAKKEIKKLVEAGEVIMTNIDISDISEELKNKESESPQPLELE